MPRDADVIVVGAGPAGSVCAALLAHRGWHVLLLDKARFPRHKACSEFINPAGARLLSQLGLDRDLDRTGADHLAAMRVHAPGGGQFFVDFASAGANARALGLTRWRLDNLLLRYARDAGAEVREGVHVRNVLVDRGVVVGAQATSDGSRLDLRARLTIGADGHHSAIARSLGLAFTPRWPRSTGLVAHFAGIRNFDRCGEIHVTSHGYAGLAPLEAGLTNVALVAPTATVLAREGALATWFEERLARTPRLAERLEGARRVSDIRGVGPMARRTDRATGNGFLLVGDAAGFLDPFTGDGIYEALCGATLAAPVADAALRRGDVSGAGLWSYEEARRQEFAAKQRLRWLVQAFVAKPALMDYAFARLVRRSSLADILTGALAGFAPAEQAVNPAFLLRLLRP